MRQGSLTDNHYDLKFLAIGDSGVGKTCFLNQYVDGHFNEKLAPTVGIDIRDKIIEYTSPKSNQLCNVHLQLWDTAGQERFRSLTASFFRDAMGFFLVFDVTNEASFINVRNWISQIQSNAYSDDVNMILVGNKCDLEQERIISKVRAAQLSNEFGVHYIETSALLNINVTEAIKLLLDAVMARLDQNPDISKSNSVGSKLRGDKEFDDALKELDKENEAKANKRTNPHYCCS